MDIDNGMRALWGMAWCIAILIPHACANLIHPSWGTAPPTEFGRFEVEHKKKKISLKLFVAKSAVCGNAQTHQLSLSSIRLFVASKMKELQTRTR